MERFGKNGHSRGQAICRQKFREGFGEEEKSTMCPCTPTVSLFSFLRGFHCTSSYRQQVSYLSVTIQSREDELLHD